MASSSASTPASSSHSWNHEVFLSFRGEDTRKTFVDHLYTALVRHGIYTYKDDETLPQGESIHPALMKAIRESHISVIVFSENYADSSWCLDELAYIMNCRDEIGQIVIPIFYHVDPSEVRKQNGRYGEAFAKHELKNNMKVESWRRALVDAGSLSGWVPEDVANGHEAKFIKEIVDAISNILFPLISSVDENLVGLRTRLQNLKSDLEIWCGGVRMVGIWGLGGGGKTTLASSIYDEICSKFEGCCFVENIREESNNNGLEKLQVKILSGVLKQEKVNIGRVQEGRRLIQSRLCRKNVLIVLDDVDHLDQLDALAGSYDWFGEGSRIIITTRDDHLLKAHKVNVIHNISLLDNKEAMELFCKHNPPRVSIPVKEYELLSKDVVSYAHGLPLALKVLGCFLCDKDTNEWRSALARLKAIPNTNILGKLKISYDGLTLEEKKLFLDIACFFRYDYIDEAMEIFEACGFHPVIGIKVLTQKALITVTEHRKFDMHDLVQEMALYIVRGEHPYNPKRHSRVWNLEDVRKLCATDETTEFDNIEAIIIYSNDCNPLPHHHHRIVANMKKLRWIDGTGIFDRSLPTNFPPGELHCLILRRSLQSYLWEGSKNLPNLRMIKLEDLKNLIKTPDFGGLPNLERFELSLCTQLEEIHPSIGGLERLVHLEVSDCFHLKMFPPITRSHKLETFVISSCYRGFRFTEIQEQKKTEVLKHVDLDKSGKEVTSRTQKRTSVFMCCCSNLHADTEEDLNKIDVESCLEEPCLPHDNIFNLKRLHVLQTPLRKLTLNCCNLKDGDIDSVVWDFPYLIELSLRGNKFSRLNLSMWKLPRLKWLDVSLCRRLVELSGLPSSISVLIAVHCFSLKTVGDISNCKWLWNVSFGYFGSLRVACSLLGEDLIVQSMLQGNAVEESFISFTARSMDAIPKELVDGLALVIGEIRLKLPHNWFDDFSGFLICISNAAFVEHPFIKIRMKLEVDGEYSQFNILDEVPAEPAHKLVCVGYVSFNSLMRRDSTSLNLAYNTISIIAYKGSIPCRFVADLVPKKSKGDTVQTTKIPTDSSEFYEKERKDGKKTYKIQHHSDSSVEIEWCPCLS